MLKKRQTPKSLVEWLGFRSSPDWTKSRWLGIVLGSLLLLASALLFLGAILAAFFVIGRIVSSSSALSFGSSTLIAALLGAPFVIWGTVLKHLTVSFQKEGHMTDRIHKAVEQLGADKSVERIGRPVTIWTGKRDIVSYNEDRAMEFLLKERTKLGDRARHREYNQQTDVVDEEWRITVSTWPEERTVIEWQGEPVELSAQEIVGSEGSWQVFKETRPNIEVRSGAILSMERIAQDSTRHDNGRDHVRIMEILCAYIRENAPASRAKFGAFPSDSYDGTLEKKTKCSPSSWINNLDRPQSDIQLVISVIGRRSVAQIDVENKYSDGKLVGYTLDLTHTMLRKVNFEGLNFSKASFFRCCMEGIHCQNADFSGCNFIYTNLTGANGKRVNFANAKLQSADLSYSTLPYSNLRNCVFSHTHFVKSNLSNAEIQFMENPGGTQVNRAFFTYSILKNSLIQGDMMGVIFQFHEQNGDHPTVDALGIRFRNANLGGETHFFGHSDTQICYRQDHLDLAFGDSTVYLPNGLSRPEHWPLNKLDSSRFDKEWKKWLNNPAAYIPPTE
ncbi:hypothetical protein JI58_07145 [Marinosulfonomonas sp. PRT-SC04]|nr:hypothetical protein JI58_07145 [Marinosulfonomonas sp. PRT-SC04]